MNSIDKGKYIILELEKTHNSSKILEILDSLKQELVLIDLTKIKHIDSEGLSLILKINKKCNDNNKKMILINANDIVNILLRISRLDDVFTSFKNEDDFIENYKI